MEQRLMWFTILKRHFHQWNGAITDNMWRIWVRECIELLIVYEDAHPNSASAMSACTKGYLEGTRNENKRPAIVINISRYFPDSVSVKSIHNGRHLQKVYMEMRMVVFGLKPGQMSVERERAGTIPKSIWSKD